MALACWEVSTGLPGPWGCGDRLYLPPGRLLLIDLMKNPAVGAHAFIRVSPGTGTGIIENLIPFDVQDSLIFFSLIFHQGSDA